jgi:hypothetical protein
MRTYRTRGLIGAAMILLAMPVAADASQEIVCKARTMDSAG